MTFNKKSFLAVVGLLALSALGYAAGRELQAQTIKNGSGVLTLPTSNDTLVGRATTDTMTNKTLTAPAISSPTGLVKGDVGLGNVDNTSDATKNAASATLTNKSISGATNTLSAIPDSSLNTISTAGKVSGSAITSGTIAGSTIINTSGTITSGANVASSYSGPLTGNASTATSLAANPSDCGAGTKATAIDASGNLTCSAASLTADVSGILPIANGGTNASSKAGAFDSLSPMTTAGDIIIGGASGTGTRLAIGSASQVLTVSGGAPSWQPATGGVTTGIWSGYHDSTCHWTTTSSSYASVSGGSDGSCNFVEVTNISFGTVTSMGSKLPGITFTPARAGQLKLCAGFAFTNSGTGNNSAFAFRDTVNNITYAAFDKYNQPTGGQDLSLYKCSVVTAPSTSSISFEIWIKTDAGTTTLAPATYPTESIHWDINTLN